MVQNLKEQEELKRREVYRDSYQALDANLPSRW